MNLALYVKNYIIDAKETSEYYINLITGILKSDISIDPKIRTLLNAIRADLFISDAVDIDYDSDSPDHLNFEEYY